MNIITNTNDLKVNNIYLLVTWDEIGQANANDECLLHSDQMILISIEGDDYYFQSYDRTWRTCYEADTINTHFITHGKLIDCGEFITWK